MTNNHKTVMVFSGKYNLWDTNTSLQSFVEINNIDSICAINSKDTQLENAMISKYNIVNYKITDVFGLKLFDDDTMKIFYKRKRPETNLPHVLSMYDT